MSATKVWNDLIDKELAAAQSRGKPITREKAFSRVAHDHPAAHAAYIAAANQNQSRVPAPAAPKASATPAPSAGGTWRDAVKNEYHRRVTARIEVERRDAESNGGEMPTDRLLRIDAEYAVRAADRCLYIAFLAAEGEMGKLADITDH